MAVAMPMPADSPAPTPTPAWVGQVEAARRGDEKAFRSLHRSFGSMVHGLLLARVDPGSADDLTQEVFLRAWERLDRLHDPRAWPGWLAAIARNRATDHVRARPRPGTLPPELQAASPDPSVRVDAEALLQMIRELPTAHVEPMILRFVEGMSGPEIAERTGLSPGYVRVNLHRGVKLLRQRIAKQTNKRGEGPR